MEEPVLRGHRILIVDDSEDNHELIGIYLGLAGAEVVKVDRGRWALSCAQQSHFDLILMDLEMPDLSGQDTAALMRAKGYDGRIVALTAHAEIQESIKTLKGRFDDYLIKPIERRALVGALARCLAS